MNIREATPQDAATLAMLVSASNQDVATRFGLNRDNCPKHPSFCTVDWIKADLTRGERYFVVGNALNPIACVAFELAGAGVGYLNRLSVLPARRRSGIGARLVQHVLALARSSRLQHVSIGVMGDHLELKRWYSKFGFVIGDTRHFAHLPFSVTYMTCAVSV